jgi:lipoprotein-anchoring transpeptidase ErfK/SrfK
MLAAVLAVLVAGCGGLEEAQQPTRLPPAPTETTAPAAAEPVAAPPADALREREAARASAPPARPAAPARCSEGDYVRMRTQRVSHAAVVRTAAQAYRRPGRGPLARFGRLNENGVATVFGVLGRSVGPDCRARWYRVQLPMKPNGIVGWVRAADVELHAVRTRILVDLTLRRVTLFEDGRVVLRAPAAIGSAATPTPVGSFYVNQRLRPTDPTGPFGPGAVGISAFSEVLTGWVQGGPVALHGTNRPDLIGQAVSNGCIRLHNDVLQRLFALAPPGTPVVVRA